MNKIKMIMFFMIVCLALTACSSNDTSSNDGNKVEFAQSTADITEEVTEPAISYYEILGKKDFGGETFTILDANDYPGSVINFAEDGITGEPINDALYERDTFIEEKYGVNIEYIQISNANSGCNTLEKSILAEENTYDLVVSTLLGATLDRLSTCNVLYNLTDAPYLSLTSPYWSKLIYENIMFNNKLYYTGGDIFLPSYTNSPGLTVFNKKLLQDYGIENNLYDLVFKGKWTIDILENLTKDMDIDLNGDDKMTAEEDFFGLLFQYNAMNMAIFLAGIGGKYSEIIDNTINVNLNSDNNLNKIDKLANWLEKPNYTDQENPREAFKENRVLFLVTTMSKPKVSLRNMESEYGILPMPKWDEHQATYVSYMNGWSSGFIAIPQNVDIEKSAFLTEAMAYAGYEKLRRPVYDISLKTKAARDEESERIIDIIIETAYMDLNGVYNFGGSYDIVRNAVMDKTPFSSEYAKIESRIQGDIDKFINSISGNNG